MDEQKLKKAAHMEKVAMLLAAFADDLKNKGGFSIPASSLYFNKKDAAKEW